MAIPKPLWSRSLELSSRGEGGAAKQRAPGNALEEIVTLTAPASLEADQYRLLRWELDRLRKARGISVVAVTSATIAEGKTTVALNVAGAMCRDPLVRVLLVDADLRRPATSARLGVDGPDDGPGLAGLLVDNGASLENAIRRVPPYPLSILPAGQLEGVPFELLRSPLLEQLLTRAREQFDFVIVDTPPLLLLPDCRALLSSVDGFLLVLAAHRTPRRLVESALGSLGEEKTLGIVLNRVDQPRAGYYKQYYGVMSTDRRERRFPWRR